MAQAQFWLKEGTVVGGRYTLETVLGKGGYGITYKGMDNRLQIPVAIKEYFPLFWCTRFVENGSNVTVNQGMEIEFCKGLDRVADEARTLAQLGNISGVVRVTDFFEENGTGYLVMEYLDGKNLKQMVEGFGGQIPADVLIPVLSPILFALRSIHERGMIHRDLSPDNIMMLSDGSVRLIDFGNARDTTDNKSMTLAMKEGFAPPEQYRSKGQGPYTDVYGLCATLYYCLTGKRPPFHMDRLGGVELLTLSQQGVKIPKWQEQAIMQGLDLYVNSRIQDMDELWKRLYIEPLDAATMAESEKIPEQPVEIPVQRVDKDSGTDAAFIPVTTQVGEIQKTVGFEPFEASAVPYVAPESPVEEQEDVTSAYSDVFIPPMDSYASQGPDKDDYDAAVAALSDSLHNLRKVCAHIFRKVAEW